MNPVLYILCRNDLASLNNGKMIAQACHAANQMTKHALSWIDSKPIKEKQMYNALYNEWVESADGFGTTISLSMNEKEMRESVNIANIIGLHAGITHDPSYPLLDGRTLHLIPLDTCAFVFGNKDDCWFLRQFPLVP